MKEITPPGDPGKYLQAPWPLLPNFTVVTQCNIVAGAWDFCQRIKAEYPGTAKAASAEDYLRRTFATLQSDIVACVFPTQPDPQPQSPGEAK